MKHVSSELARIVAAAEFLLRQWQKQLLGHLFDSASNNSPAIRAGGVG
ncbi:MAG TPA: hypothetical protein VN924_17025 [Bryobacteraceae bacterium]|nr:hypothetical protein [Bryobacteraceae bacterium]